ncbi:MAG TPA: hypothetical protein VEB19_12345 [Gemmatimonadaceae bacterium]|nr:hypothetical protein [Gemmatimonadaceae bacterium]
MNLVFRTLALSFALVAVSAAGADAQTYPNVDTPFAIADGDTVQLLIRFMNDGGPAARRAGKRLDLVYATRIPASNAAARRAQADRAAQVLGPQAVELGVRYMSLGICDTRSCAERKDPPADWYLYERTNTGWKRVP